MGIIRRALMRLFNAIRMFRQVEAQGGVGIHSSALSPDMLDAIELWCDMVAGEAPWNAKAKPCGVLDQIGVRLSNLISREISVECANPAIEQAMLTLDADCPRLTEYMALAGGCVVRPVFASGKLQHEAIPLGRYLPTSYDFDGTLKGCIILKRIAEGERKWLLSERHEFDGANHAVECKLWRDDHGALKETTLADCPATETLTPSYVWQGCGMPMVVEFRNASINRVDGSPVPVPVFAGSERLIQDADEQWERMRWEQEGGALRVFADRDMFNRRKLRDGTVVDTGLSPELNRLVVKLDGDGSTDGTKITQFAPSLRTEQQTALYQQILKRIELACGLGKGTLSDLDEVQQTATQYTGGRNELYALVDKIEDEIKVKYEATARVFAYMAQAYGLGRGTGDIVVKWNDDQTRKDMSAAKTMALQEITQGVRSKWEYRADFFGEDEATARANTPQEAQPEMSYFGA